MPVSPELNTNGVVRLSIESNGAPVADSLQVVSVVLDTALNKIPMATITVLDGDMPDQDFPLSNEVTFKPGSTIQIKAGYGQTEESLFQGVVVKHSIKISGNNYARLVLECRDQAVAMTIGRRNANYVDVTDTSIITTIIGKYSGLSAQVDSTTTTYKELVQYYCTDWDFLLARAEANGLLVAVENGKVTVQAPQITASPALQVTYGIDLMEFHADLDARTQLTAVQGVSWDLQNQAVLTGKSASPATLNEQGDLSSSELAQVVGPSTLTLQTAAPVEKTVLDTWAEAQQVKAGLARIRGRMTFQGSALAKIGTLLALAGVGNRFTGSVFVSAVRHDIADGNWLTEVEFGMPSDWFAERRDLVAPPAAGLLPGVEGLQIGVVKKLDTDPEGQYKIQVAVPVMQATTEGVWARLATFYASESFGAFFIPEIGDEVVLGYINNDPSHPVILGSIYSSKRQAPYSLTAENNTKAVVTRSQLKLTFDDEKKVITVITPGNNQIVISDDAKSILIQDQNNNKVELSSSGILLDSPKDITIQAQGNVSVTATGNISLSAKADVKLDGLNLSQNAQVGFTAKGNASAELSAAGQTTIKGALVMIN